VYVVVGLLLLIVPGVIWGITYSFALFGVVDKQMSVKDALAFSKKITEGKKWALFVFGLVLLGINVLGVLCLGVGIIVSVPLSLLMTAIVYDELQPESEELFINDNPPTQQVVVNDDPPVQSSISQYQI
jgi:uncharacterized membrane protein